MQEDRDGIEHSISYCFKKKPVIINGYQKKYSTLKKEALALLLAVKFYDVYVSSSPFSISVKGSVRENIHHRPNYMSVYMTFTGFPTPEKRSLFHCCVTMEIRDYAMHSMAIAFVELKRLQHLLFIIIIIIIIIEWLQLMRKHRVFLPCVWS